MRTPLCDLLHIDYPIIQSGMGRVAGPELVAEVSNAGALGILAGLGLAADELRRQIRRVRELTDRPFGVNLWLHEDLMPPRSPADIPGDTLHSAHAVLNRFRERLDLPRSEAAPPPYPDVVGDAFGVVVAERVPVWSIGLGNPTADMIERCHGAGICVMAMVTTVDDARAVAASGVDLVVAQGAEAGGHRSTWKKRDSAAAASVATMVLVPQIVDAVRQPVIAAGGIADGRGLVAALALGAQGALLGTRFVATRESMAPPMYKASLVAASSDDTRVTDTFTGLYARALRNAYVTEYEASGAPVLPPLLQTKAAEDIYVTAARRGDREYFPMWAGQSAGLIADLPPAGDVVRAVAREAEAVLARIAQMDGGKAERR